MNLNGLSSLKTCYNDDGRLHREDGPAIQEWAKEHNVSSVPYEEWDEETKMLFKLTWG